MKNLVGGLAVAALALGVGAQGAAAQDWAKANLAKSPRHGEFVTINEPGGRKLQAFVVYPEVKGKAPVVVMIHEIFGQSDWALEMADELAGAGYIVVEPDLLSGFGPAPKAAAPAEPAANDATMDHSHMQAPAGAGAAFVGVVTADLDAAADYGKKLPAANGKLFVAGFCWGGGKTFLFATHRRDLSGAMVFYGPPPPVEAMKNINAPVYGFYAGNDARITATIPDTQAAMKAAGKTYDPKIYEGAGHGFMRAGEAPDANVANTAARTDGFKRLVDLLGGVR
jgi:carboxymethylenebutenolidase